MGTQLLPSKRGTAATAEHLLQLAEECRRADWRHLAIMIEFVHATADSSPKPKANWQSQGMFKMSTTGMNASMQACWPLLNRVVNQRLLQAPPRMQQTLWQFVDVMNVTVTS